MTQITEEAAHQMGAKGAEPTEAERRLFEAWMRGHCWKVCGEWNGRTYFSEHEKHGGVDPLAMNTRQLWAAWRDRGALGAGDYQAGRESMLAELRAAEIDTLSKTCGLAVVERDALRTENEALRRDAERLDWIERKLFMHKWNGVVGSGCATNWTIAPDYRHTTADMKTGDIAVDFRAAIDAALRQEKQDADK